MPGKGRASADEALLLALACGATVKNAAAKANTKKTIAGSLLFMFLDASRCLGMARFFRLKGRRERGKQRVIQKGPGLV